MKAMATKYGGVRDRLIGAMTRAQDSRLKVLAEEAYQPEQYAGDLSFDEAARRIDALKAEIALGGLILGRSADYFFFRLSVRSRRLRLLPTFFTAFLTAAAERRVFLAS